MKTLITAPAYFDQETTAQFQRFSSVTKKQMTREQLLNTVHEYNILAIRVDTNIDKELIDKATNLKIIASATLGIDHINVEYAKEKGIEVISLHGANTAPTAEHVIGLILALSRKIHAAHASVLKGNWKREEFIGTSLEGKKIGIVGFGRIGQHVGKIAIAIGMQLLAYDPYLPDKKFMENNATKMELNALLKDADIITLHMILNEETTGMFNKQKFKLMKPNAFFINCSRGQVINEADLVAALKQNRIAGAALDVYCNEPLENNSQLIQYAQEHDNLILTPHIAGSTIESIHNAGMFVATKTKEIIERNGINNEQLH